MSAIKRFFERKKLDRKFKKAGDGHSLGAAGQQPAPRLYPAHQSTRPSTSRSPPSQEQQRAAEAALARIKPVSAGPRTGRDAIKAQVRREMEQERKQLNESHHVATGPQEVRLEAAQVVDSCGGVFFTCDLLPDVMLPKKEMDEKIKEFLAEQLKEDAEMASALLIHTVNRDSEKVKVCIDTICKYLDNLLANPGEEKFRKIRCSNKAFQERVASVTGGTQFLLCAGYQPQRLPSQDAEDDFYVISESDSLDVDKLNNLKEVLVNAEPIRPELWRAERLFHCPANTNMRFGELPLEFYAISKAEMMREKQAKQEAVERLGMLRTKAMKERDELKELRRYRYTLLRIRFPRDIYLQAIFKSKETLQDLLDFIKERLEFDWLPFWIFTPNGQKVLESDKTLAELHLVPACIINFGCDKQLLEEALQGAGRSGGASHVLQSRLLDRLENWSI